QGRASAADAGSRPPLTAALEARAGDELDVLGEAAHLVGRHDDQTSGRAGDIARAAAARQAHGRVGVGADDRAVHVAPTVDLGAADEPGVDAPGLQVEAEDL